MKENLKYYWLAILVFCFINSSCRKEESISVYDSFSPENRVEELKTIDGLVFANKDGGSSKVGKELGNIATRNWHFTAPRDERLSADEISSLLYEIQLLLKRDIESYGADVGGRGGFTYIVGHSMLSYRSGTKRGSLSIIVNNYSAGVSLHISLVEEPDS